MAQSATVFFARVNVLPPFRVGFAVGVRVVDSFHDFLRLELDAVGLPAGIGRFALHGAQRIGTARSRFGVTHVGTFLVFIVRRGFFLIVVGTVFARWIETRT